MQELTMKDEITGVDSTGLVNSRWALTKT